MSVALPASIASYPIGEVVSATTTGFTAQCIELPRPDALTNLPDPPPLGAWVRVGQVVPAAATVTEAAPDEDFDPFETPAPSLPVFPAATPDAGAGDLLLYGIVCHAETGAIDTSRPLTAFGLGEDELRRAQPHLYELLATRFSAQLVAHAVASEAMPRLRPHLPPRPPRPHAMVWEVGPEETRHLTERLDFLRPLLSGESGSGSCPTDELVAALLRNARDAWAQVGQGESFLLKAGRELATILSRDYDRLRAILERIV